MSNLGRVVIEMPKRRVGSPVFLALIAIMVAGSFARGGLAVGAICLGGIVLVGGGMTLMWNLQPRITAIHDGGLVVRSRRGVRYAAWNELDRIESRISYGRHGQMQHYDVWFKDGEKVTLTPAADGGERTRDALNAIRVGARIR